jgi:nitrate reductase NapE component
MLMSTYTKKETSERLSKVTFLFLFFGIWLSLPFLNADFNDERTIQFLKAIFPINLLSIALFFINTELVMPRILPKYGVQRYIISLIALIIFFIGLQYFLKEAFIPPHPNPKFRAFNLGRFAAFNVFPVIMIGAISAVYGFINYLTKQDKSRQEEKQERLQSELSFLRSQISPHFIFNVLNSIVYLIRSKSENAESVTIKLSELMRYMLYESDDSQVSLDRELKYLQNYIELQKVRFEDDVEINLKMEGNIGNQLIEPMLMIPFVENAFKHGVGMILDPVIDIFVHCETDELTYKIKNKIAPESTDDKDKSSGIGLRNVKRRLELLYPNAHSLEISKRDEWFEVEMKIKFKKIGES